MGMNEDLDAIKGFEDAWRHPEHPVYAPKDHPSWRSYLHKYPKWHYNFFSGDAYYCIPPYPFRGEVETYNFFISTEIWRWYKANGKLNPKATFTVMNANDKFVQYNDSADSYIKEELERQGVKIEYG
jgi:sulfide:quinone oxidoreductase